MLIRSEAGVEYQFSGQQSSLLLPKVDKMQNLARLVGLGDSRACVAENALGGVARQENEDALLTPAAAGNVVFFQRLFLSVGRNRMKIQIDRRTVLESSELDLLGPGGHQRQVGVLADIGAVCGQIGTFGNHVESGKQRDAFVKEIGRA